MERAAICKKGRASIKMLWQCIQHLLQIWCRIFLIAYRNMHGLLLQYFVGAFYSWRYLLQKSAVNSSMGSFIWLNELSEKVVMYCYFHFCLVFPLNPSESILQGESQVQDFHGVMPTENLAPGFFLCMMNWQPCTCSQREQMEEILVTILF